VKLQKELDNVRRLDLRSASRLGSIGGEEASRVSDERVRLWVGWTDEVVSDSGVDEESVRACFDALRSLE